MWKVANNSVMEEKNCDDKEKWTWCVMSAFRLFVLGVLTDQLQNSPAPKQKHNGFLFATIPTVFYFQFVFLLPFVW